MSIEASPSFQDAKKTSPCGAIPFEKVRDEESDLIAHARKAAGIAVEGKPIALCLSGGGIRSAVFSLGCLQALDERKLLPHFDYLSTVSGGGYIGAWLSALIKLLNPSDPTREGPIFKTKEGVQALQFLRENSSYLTPQNGLFSGDTWSLVAIYLRNLLLNWLIILPLIAATLTVPRFGAVIGSLFDPGILIALAGFFALLSMVYPTIIPSLRDVPQDPERLESKRHERPEIMRNKAEQSLIKELMAPKCFLVGRALPFALMLLFLTDWLFVQTRQWDAAKNATHLLTGDARFWLMQALVWGFSVPAIVLLAFGMVVSIRSGGTARKPIKVRQARFLFALQTFGSICAIGGCALLAERFPSGIWFFIWFPALATLSYLCAGTLFAALTDPLVEDENREWWARSAGYFLMLAIGWLAVGFVSLGVPGLLGGVQLHDPRVSGTVWFDLPGFPDHFALPAWLTVLFGGGAIAFLTRLEGTVSAAEKILPAAVAFGRKALFSVAMAAFVLALAVALSLVTLKMGPALTHLPWLDRLPSIEWREAAALLATVVILAGVSVVISLPVNINRFSTHAAYRNRLVRTFLGASNTPRDYNPFTGFSRNDNFPLHLLVDGSWQRTHAAQRVSAGEKSAGGHQPRYPRPFHVICGAANLARGERLAWQERKAVSFTFSALHCGSANLAYRPAKKYGGSRGITLGTAMTISAAAANSEMGFYSSPLKSFLLTLLNARLGWWLGNPMTRKKWERDSPLWACGPMICELFSLTDRDADFLNLSDGGHFDNTGGYEMLQRRCRRILLIDAETTRKGISNLSMRARVDFGIDLRLIAQAKGGCPVELYSVDYPAEGDAEPPFQGQLVRVYPALGELSSWSSFENVQYKSVHSDFPDDPIFNQFFAESTFESYRQLGFDILRTALKDEGSDPGPALDHLFEFCRPKPDVAPAPLGSTDGQGRPEPVGLAGEGEPLAGRDGAEKSTENAATARQDSMEGFGPR
ncbi:MAG: patatin-like phospholipase family protein [Verrucomicrobia bacterium]|nr:patatin-like phospholipase family protein [Verrucomicrobiota bacterium]